MGPWLMSHGEELGLERIRCAWEASMGPWLMSHVELRELRVQSLAKKVASMVPWLMSHGEVKLRDPYTGAPLLQWVRGI